MFKYWWAAGFAVPAAVMVKLLTSVKKKKIIDKSHGGENDFFCERVCTSDRLLRRMGDLAKDTTPGNCVTVCGTSAVDACSDACARAVCINMHQVPAWNENCTVRCTNECLKGRTNMS